MRRAIRLAAMFAAAAAIPEGAALEASPFGKPPVADQALADMRGGFITPGGLDISVAVQSDTRVNGVLLLRTVLVAVAAAAPTLTAYAQEQGAPPPPPGTAAAAAGGGVVVNIGTSAAPLGGAPDGLKAFDLKPGEAVATATGTLKLDQTGGASRVVLSGPQIDIQHLTGQSFGSMVANRSNDVAIDISTIVNLDLSSVPTLSIGSGLFKIEGVASDSSLWVGR